jgi:hypothetical protein
MRRAAVSLIRRALQLVHTPRRLHEKASKSSCPQEEHTARAELCA